MDDLKIGNMIRDAVRSLFRRPFTVQYATKPGEMVPVPERFRGKIIYDREACVGCLLCIKTCPTGAIITTEERKVTFNLDRCVFCGQCKETCPKEAISFASEFEMVVHDREELFVR